MKEIKLSIKHELNEEEFAHLLDAFQEEVHNQMDITSISRSLTAYIKQLTPAHFIHLFLLEENGSLLHSVERPDISVPIMEEKSLLLTCLQTQNPQLVNDIKRSKLYNPKIDNPFGYSLKNLLLVPLYDVSDTLFAILWMGIPTNDINQFISKDIDHIMQLCQHISYVQPHHSIENISSKEKNSTVSKKSDAENSPATFTEKIKSFFSKSKKHYS